MSSSTRRRGCWFSALPSGVVTRWVGVEGDGVFSASWALRRSWKVPRAGCAPYRLSLSVRVEHLKSLCFDPHPSAHSPRENSMLPTAQYDRSQLSRPWNKSCQDGVTKLRLLQKQKEFSDEVHTRDAATSETPRIATRSTPTDSKKWAKEKERVAREEFQDTSTSFQIPRSDWTSYVTDCLFTLWI